MYFFVKQLPNHQILYRAISYEYFIKANGNIDAKAFIRRYQKRTQSYEKNLSSALNPEDTYSTLRWCFGVIRFTVKNLRDLGLDAIEDKPDHVSIINLPHPEKEEDEANIIARKLAKKARIYARWSKEESQQIKKGELDWRDFLVAE